MSAPPDDDNGDSVLDELVRTLSQQISASGWVDAELQRKRDAGEPIISIFDVAAAAEGVPSVAVSGGSMAEGGNEQSGGAAGAEDEESEVKALEGQLAALSSEISAIDAALKLVVSEQALKSTNTAAGGEQS